MIIDIKRQEEEWQDRQIEYQERVEAQDEERDYNLEDKLRDELRKDVDYEDK